MNKLDLNLKQRLISFREKIGITQQEAGKLFGVSLQTWQRWEYGINPPGGAALKLLGYYEINPPQKLDISKMCKTIRDHLGLTKGNMAKTFGVDADSWGCWERGVMKPSNRHIQKIEQMFNEIQEKESLQEAS